MPAVGVPEQGVVPVTQMLVNCILFAHYCKSTLFYKDFFNVTSDTFKVNRIANKNLKEQKNLIKHYGYNKIWTRGVFSFYGDLRPLAVEAGFGKWSENGLIVNEKYGTNFTDEDRVIADKLSQKLMEDENLKGSIDNNARDIAKVKFDELFEKELVEMVNNHFDFYQKINDDKDTRGYLKDRIFDMVYRKIKK